MSGRGAPAAGVERGEGREEARAALGALGVERASDRELEGAVVGAQRRARLPRAAVESTNGSSEESGLARRGDQLLDPLRRQVRVGEALGRKLVPQLAGGLAASESGRAPRRRPGRRRSRCRTPPSVPITRNPSTTRWRAPRVGRDLDVPRTPRSAALPGGQRCREHRRPRRDRPPRGAAPARRRRRTARSQPPPGRPAMARCRGRSWQRRRRAPAPGARRRPTTWTGDARQHRRVSAAFSYCVAAGVELRCDVAESVRRERRPPRRRRARRRRPAGNWHGSRGTAKARRTARPPRPATASASRRRVWSARPIQSHVRPWRRLPTALRAAPSASPTPPRPGRPPPRGSPATPAALPRHEVDYSGTPCERRSARAAGSPGSRPSPG